MSVSSWTKAPRLLPIAGLALLAACSGEGSDSALSDNFVQVLESTPESTFFSAIDVDKMEVDLGIELGDCNNPETALDEILPLFGGGNDNIPATLIISPSLPFTRAVNDLEPWDEAFGFNPCTLSAYATVASEDITWVALPEIDHETVEASLTTEPFWSEFLTISEIEGATVFDWGDETRPEGRSSLRLNQGGSAALVGERTVLWASNLSSDLPGTISQIATDGSILDQPNFAPLLETMGSLDAYALTVSLLPEDLEDFVQFGQAGIESEDFTESLNAIAWGATVYEGENTYVMAFTNDTEALAQDNLDVVAAAALSDSIDARPWSDQFTITDSWVDGNQSIFRIGPPLGGQLESDLDQTVLGDNLLLSITE